MLYLTESNLLEISHWNFLVLMWPDCVDVKVERENNEPHVQEKDGQGKNDPAGRAS